MMSRQDIIGNTKRIKNIIDNECNRWLCILLYFAGLWFCARRKRVKTKNISVHTAFGIRHCCCNKISDQWFKYVFINLFKNAREKAITFNSNCYCDARQSNKNLSWKLFHCIAHTCVFNAHQFDEFQQSFYNQNPVR